MSHRNPHGPNITAAIAERRSESNCCVCDGRMPHRKYPGSAKYTCGTERCKREWVRLLSLDRTYRAQVKRLAIVETMHAEIHTRLEALFETGRAP